MRALVLHPGLPGQREYRLRDGEYTLGRTEDNDIVLPHLSLSRRHARLVVGSDGAVLTDLDSKNGSAVNGLRVATRPLAHGDRLRLGDVDLVYIDDTQSGLRPAFQHTLTPRTVSFDRLIRPGPSGLNLASGDASRRDAEKLQVLLEATEQLASVDNLETILARVVELVGKLLDVDRVALLLVDPKRDHLVERVTWSRLSHQGAAHSQSIARWVVEHRAAALFSDARIDQRLVDAMSVQIHAICSAMAAPLIARERVLGVLYVDNLTIPERFTEEDLHFLTGFANQAALGIENALLYERVEREAAMRQNLLRFFPDTIAQRLLAVDGASLATVETVATALFCDLTDFTGLGVRLGPRATLEVLQVYLQAMAEVVFRHEGTLEKYIGDAVMAVWGAPFSRPDDPVRALRTAVAMQRAMDDVNRIVARQGVRLGVHIGLNTGPVAAGNIGSSRYLQYAAIGDATTTAARVCNKAGESEIVLTEATLRALGADAPPVDGPEVVEVKGHPEPVTIYRVRWRELVA